MVCEKQTARKALQIGAKNMLRRARVLETGHTVAISYCMKKGPDFAPILPTEIAFWYLFDTDDFRANFLLKPDIMLYQQHRRLILKDQFLDLHPGKHIDKIQRFIPDI